MSHVEDDAESYSRRCASSRRVMAFSWSCGASLVRGRVRRWRVGPFLGRSLSRTLANCAVHPSQVQVWRGGVVIDRVYKRKNRFTPRHTWSARMAHVRHDVRATPRFVTHSTHARSMHALTLTHVSCICTAQTQSCRHFASHTAHQRPRLHGRVRGGLFTGSSGRTYATRACACACA